MAIDPSPVTRDPSATGVHKRLIVALAILGFGLRLAFAFGYWVDKPLTGDEQEYFLLATRLATGHGFTYPAPSTSGSSPRRVGRPPAFAFFLAGVLRGTRNPLVSTSSDAETPECTVPQSSSDVPGSIKVAQALVGAIGILLVAALVGLAAGPRAAVAGAAIAAAYPPLVWICGYVLSEPFFSTLALAAAWLLQRANDATDGRRIGVGFSAGVMAGAAMLTREAMAFFLPLAAVWLLLRRKLAVAIVFAAGVAVVALPWMTRNHLIHHRFVLSIAHGGVTLWTGNNPLAHGEGDLAANPEMGRARIALEQQYPTVSDEDLDALYYREAVKFVTEHPLAWLGLTGKKLFYTFVPIGPSYRLHSARYLGASLLSYLLLLPFAAIGAWQLARRRRLARLSALWLLAASALLANLAFFPQERFRIPILDPTAVVCAAALCRDRSTPVAATETDARAS